MKYYVTLNKKYQYVKVYKILKKVNEESNVLSQKFMLFVNKYFVKKGGGEKA